MEPETTDMTLFVRRTTEDATRWNRQRIVDALVQETKLDSETAEAVSKEVEKQVLSSGITVLTSALIREFVDAQLIERGLEEAKRRHASIGLSLYDVSKLILLENKENANLPHNPEGTNLILAEGIKREYALLDVFSSDVAEAHIMGDIHLHGLGYIDRPYASCQSLEYLKKFGLNLPHALTVAKPAKHAEVLLAHMVRFSITLQGHFAGVIAWDAVNFAFAPYLASMNDGEVRQFAQMLIYEFSQLTAARGGQSMFADIHLYWDVPAHLEGRSIIGPGGEVTDKTYSDYLADARRFAWALFAVFKEGDARGMPFIFPRPLMHIGESFFQAPGHEEFLNHICEVAAQKGNTCFLFDRSNRIRTSCIALNMNGGENLYPHGRALWEQRCFVIQNVTLNLPRLGYKAAGDNKRLFSLLTESLELMTKAHLQKRHYTETILSHGDAGPLAMLTMKHDDTPYLKMQEAAYLMGMTGLNELVSIHTGKELHHDDALAFGLKVVAHMQSEAKRLSSKYGMLLFGEQTPAETTAYRFARLDLKYYSPRAGHFVKGDFANGGIYYTNSTQLSVTARVSPFERVQKEGLFHPLIGGGVMTNIWLGDYDPNPAAIAALVSRTFSDTQNDHLLFSPEFVNCHACGQTSRGLKDICPFCGAQDSEGIARITQYFSRTSGWNKGKLAELRDRKTYTNTTDL